MFDSLLNDESIFSIKSFRKAHVMVPMGAFYSSDSQLSFIPQVLEPSDADSIYIGFWTNGAYSYMTPDEVKDIQHLPDGFRLSYQVYDTDGWHEVIYRNTGTRAQCSIDGKPLERGVDPGDPARYISRKDDRGLVWFSAVIGPNEGI